MFGLDSRALAAAAYVFLCAAPVQATDENDTRAVNGFDWFANAARPATDAEAAARTRAAIVKVRGLSNGATWVCSPAGAGRPASCQKS
jgi:hypothetical protein